MSDESFGFMDLAGIAGISGGLGLAGASAQGGAAKDIFDAQARTQFDRMHEMIRYDSDKLRRQNQFALNMSNTSVRRRMADLKAAGINPILAASKEASSPSSGSGGGTAIPGGPSHFMPPNVMQAGISGAANAVSMTKNLADAKLTLAKADAIKPISEVGDTGGKWVGKAMDGADKLLDAASSQDVQKGMGQVFKAIKAIDEGATELRKPDKGPGFSPTGKKGYTTKTVGKYRYYYNNKTGKLMMKVLAPGR